MTKHAPVTLLYRDALRWPWARDDAAWFAARPSRSHRVRRAYPGEFEPFDLDPAAGWRTVVRQVETGARLRLPVFMPSLAREIEDDAAAHALFDCVQAGIKPSGDAYLRRWRELRQAQARPQ